MYRHLQPRAQQRRCIAGWRDVASPHSPLSKCLLTSLDWFGLVKGRPKRFTLPSSDSCSCFNNVKLYWSVHHFRAVLCHTRLFIMCLSDISARVERGRGCARLLEMVCDVFLFKGWFSWNCINISFVFLIYSILSSYADYTVRNALFVRIIYFIFSLLRFDDTKSIVFWFGDFNNVLMEIIWLALVIVP